MKLFACVFCLTFAVGLSAAATKKKVVRNSSTTHSARSTTSSPKRGKKGTSSSAARSAPRPYVQQTPSPERYREIQQALAARGYLKSEPNGVWDSQSADAMRQFQTENNLSPTGKLSSATLIALGLGAGPQSASTPAAVQAAAPTPSQEP